MLDSQLHSAALPLSDHFPDNAPKAKFQLGDRVRFVPMPAEDYGIVVGIQFAPAQHLQAWGWRYIVWLDPESPSRAWTSSDLAWEDDLELLIPAPVDRLTQEQST